MNLRFFLSLYRLSRGICTYKHFLVRVKLFITWKINLLLLRINFSSFIFHNLQMYFAHIRMKVHNNIFIYYHFEEKKNKILYPWNILFSRDHRRRTTIESIFKFPSKAKTTKRGRGDKNRYSTFSIYFFHEKFIHVASKRLIS